MNPVSQRGVARPGGSSEALARDPSLPAACADGELGLPSADEVVALVAEELTLEGGPAPRSASCTYARWKPRTSLTASFRVAFEDGAQRIISLKRYAGEKAESLAESFHPDRYAVLNATPLRAFASLPERGTVLYSFPCDRELDGLARVLDWKRTARRIDRAGIYPGLTVRKRASNATMLRYKPERRAVLALAVELRGDGGVRRSERLAARVLHPAKALELTHRRRLALHVPGAPPAPQLLDLDALPGILLEEWIELAAEGSAGVEGMAAAGALLAALHTRRSPESGGLPEPPGGAAQMLATVPELAARASAVGVGVEPARRACAWVHGDFHLRQVGVRSADGEPVLLDLDELRAGDPVEDLASCVADELAHDLSLDHEELIEALLSSYAAHGAQDPDRRHLARWIAHELLGRAAGCLRRLEVNAIERAARLITRAGELAGRSEGAR